MPAFRRLVCPSLLLVLLFSAQAPAQTFNCDNFWVGGFPTDSRDPPITMPVCEEYPVDRVDPLAGRFRIFHPPDWLDEPGEARIGLAIEALGDAIRAYSVLGELPDVYVLFVGTEHESSAGVKTNWTVPEAAEPCPMLVFPRALRLTEIEFRHTMAHEAFHCLQDHHFRDEMHGPTDEAVTDWWVEGGAEYSVNIVYPDADVEHLSMTAYDADEPLLNQDYPASLFFLDLTNVLGNAGMLELFDQMPESGGLLQQLAALSAFPDIGQHWHVFGQRYLDLAIDDPSGLKLPYSEDRGPRLAIDGSGEHTLSASAFTLGRAVLRFGAGGVYSIEVSAEGPDGSESARALEDGARWTALPDLVVTDCDEPLEYQYLLTTAANSSDQREVTLEVAHEDNEECGCTAIILSDPEVRELEAASCGNPLPACMVGFWQVDSDVYAAELRRRLPATFEIVSAVNNSTLVISNDGAAEACIDFSTHAVRGGEVRLEARSVGHGASVSKLGMRDESAVCSTVVSETIEATATTNIGGVSNETQIDLRDGVFGEQSRIECRADELWIYTPAPGVGEVTTLFRRR